LRAAGALGFWRCQAPDPAARGYQKLVDDQIIGIVYLETAHG
jgi:hypothetical protein